MGFREWEIGICYGPVHVFIILSSVNIHPIAFDQAPSVGSRPSSNDPNPSLSGPLNIMRLWLALICPGLITISKPGKRANMVVQVLGFFFTWKNYIWKLKDQYEVGTDLCITAPRTQSDMMWEMCALSMFLRISLTGTVVQRPIASLANRPDKTQSDWCRSSLGLDWFCLFTLDTIPVRAQCGDLINQCQDLPN